MGCFYDEYSDFDCLDIEDLINNRVQSRKKKSSKMIGKKFRRFKTLTGSCSKIDQKRKNRWKRNYKLEDGYTSFDEIIIEDEIKVEIQTKANYNERKSKCECLHFYQERDYPDNYDDIFAGEAPQISLIIDENKRLASRFGVTDELCPTTENFSVDIPEELLIKVLSRLPIKTTSRFKCVSKHWQHMILNNVSVKDASNLLILSRSIYGGFSSFHSLNNEARVERMYSPMEEHLRRGHIVKAHSSCNGLLLIQIDNNLFVWNPLTKFNKKVLTHYSLVHQDSLADLCFDSSNDEYKVAIVAKSLPYYGNINVERFHLGSCKTNRWEIIDVPDYLKNLSQGPFFKGYRHWICKGRPPTSDELSNNSFIPPPQHIVYLDLSTNKFIQVPTPKPKRGEHKFIGESFLGLGVIDKCLCVTRWFRSWGGNIEFLVMKEYGNEDSWDVMFVISNFPGYFCYGTIEPLFKTREGELLLNMNMCYRSTGVKAYDVYHKFFRDMLSWTKGYFDAVLYEENCDDYEHLFLSSGDPDSPLSFSDWSSFGWDRFSNNLEDDNDFSDEEDSNFDQWELEDIEVKFLSRMNRWNKQLKKKRKTKLVKIATKRSRKYCNPDNIVENRKRKGKWNRNKRTYRSKCRYINIHDMILQAKAVMMYL